MKPFIRSPIPSVPVGSAGEVGGAEFSSRKLHEPKSATGRMNRMNRLNLMKTDNFSLSGQAQGLAFTFKFMGNCVSVFTRFTMVGGLLLAGFLCMAAEDDRVVAVTSVTGGSMERVVRIQGELLPWREIELHAKVSGYLKQVLVEVGQRVHAGEILAELEMPETQAERKRAAAIVRRQEEAVRKAAAAHSEARLRYDRLRVIHTEDSRLVAGQELDAARLNELSEAANVALEESQLEVEKAELARLDAFLGYSSIRAPFDGVVTRCHVDEGALVQAGTASSTQARPLFRLSQVQKIRLVFPVSLSHAGYVRVGGHLTVGLDDGSEEISCVVSRSARRLDHATRTMHVEADLDNQNYRLLPGMFVEVAMQLEARDNAVMVPVEAVLRKGGSRVFVVNESMEVESRTVKIGMETPLNVEILEGLRVGEKVMLGGWGQVVPGQKVRPKMMEVASHH